ncbi:MAG: superoxide dismutase family protein [Candidatus Omnitrophota bacterium]|nr:superoxide dismutase family protein [Candidatus Omnitrophota bacterium]MDZ4242591.1 superoxide dismutase family protein [Candidatus Omnitrophota bacterium]
MKKILIMAVGLVSIGAAACYAVASQKAVAVIKGAEEGSPITGRAAFEETEQGLKVSVEVIGVPNPGPHGFHIHEKGSCEDLGNAAGGHYNPHGVQHGFLPEDGHGAAHAGDMGNIEIKADGSGTLELVLPEVSLSGEHNNVNGLAVILHEKTDDFGQPTGNAGGRIGCGIIKAEQAG